MTSRDGTAHRRSQQAGAPVGLAFPTDLDAWRRWEERKHPVRRLAARVRRTSPTIPAPYFVARRTERVDVLVVLESAAASSRLALLAPIAHLDDVGVAVIAPFDPTTHLPGPGWALADSTHNLSTDFPDLSLTLAAGNYLPLGAMAYADACRRGHRFASVQHGLLTPVAPPLPPDSPALVWSAADGDFWRSGRRDVETTVVGSQLLWEASRQPKAPEESNQRPVFLGQLHAAELSRLTMTFDVTRFCRETGATYRPHPSESDKLSRLQHRAWERLGIEIDDGSVPLAHLTRPVVGAFSTGLLEAAARGVPAWAYCSRPPRWLAEMWDRYTIHPWGGPPTPAPELNERPPAAVTADWIRGAL